MNYDYSAIQTRDQWEARAALLWANYTPTQLYRLYCALWDRLAARSGCSSWDTPTLAMLYPGTLNALRAIDTARYYAGQKSVSLHRHGMRNNTGEC